MIVLIVIVATDSLATVVVVKHGNLDSMLDVQLNTQVSVTITMHSMCCSGRSLVGVGRLVSMQQVVQRWAPAEIPPMSAPAIRGLPVCRGRLADAEV